MKNINTLSKQNISIILVNFIDHLDTALYSFFAPILAPVFFPNYDPIISLISIYTIFAISFITRPIGAYIFGTIIHIIGISRSLLYSIIGVTVTTICIGLIPNYNDIGLVSPILLIILRIIQSIFAAGENTIATLYILENQSDNNARKHSYVYETSSIAGIITASFMSTIVIYFNVSYLWRIIFFIAGGIGVVAYYLRIIEILGDNKNLENNNFSYKDILKKYRKYSIDSVKILFKYKSKLFAIILITGCTHVTYYVPFVVMNNVIPLVTEITLVQMMSLNTLLLVFDMFMIPVIGKKLLKYQAKHILLTATTVLAITIPPLWYFIAGASIIYINLIRIWIILWGIIFLCPLNIWCSQLIPKKERYIIFGFGTAVSSGVFGKLIPTISLSLFYYTQQYTVIAIYICVLLVLSILAILVNYNNSIN